MSDKTYLDRERLKDAWACVCACSKLEPLTVENKPAYTTLYRAALDFLGEAGMGLADSIDAFNASDMFHRHHPEWDFTVWVNRLVLYGLGCFTFTPPSEEAEDAGTEDE